MVRRPSAMAAALGLVAAFAVPQDAGRAPHDAWPGTVDPTPFLGPLLAGPGGGGGRAYDSPYPELKPFASVLAAVKNSYVDSVDDKRLVYAAIRGMLKELDPHTTFYDPREYASLQEATSGESGTVGLELAQQDDDLFVRAVIDDSPASRAQFRIGDRIAAIDGVVAKELPLTEAETRLRGPPGTVVTLRVWRDGFAAARDFPPLRRELLRVPSVEGSLLGNDVGLVRVRAFQEQTDQDFKKALATVKDQAGPNFKGLVIDLRGNPGGLFLEAVKLADRYLAKGQQIVTSRGRDGRGRDTHTASGRETESNYPLVVLVDGGTASASEVLVGALQDHQRALVVGTPSFGKGTVQSIVPLEDGSALKITVARYYTPAGVSLQEYGIVPDVLAPVVATDDRVKERDLPNHIVHQGGPAPARTPVPWTQLAAAHGTPKDVALEVGLTAVRLYPKFVAHLTAKRAAAKPAPR